MSKLLFSENYYKDYSIMPKGIVEDSSGNYIFAGRSFITPSTSSAFATKINSSGNIIWDKTFSQPFNQFFSSIASLSDNTFVLTGSYFYSAFSGNEYIWVVRLDSNGNIIYQNAFGIVGIQSDGLDIKATDDGGYVVLGVTIENSLPISTVLKFDSNNNLTWQKNYTVGTGLSIIQTSDSGFAIVGRYPIPNSSNDNAFILRLDYAGNILWSNIYNQYEIYIPLGASIIETPSNNLIFVEKSVIMKTDSFGNYIWGQQYESLDSSLILSKSNTLYIAGSMIINDSDYAFISQIDGNGTITQINNTELLAPSAFTGLILNSANFITTCSYTPFGESNSQSVVTIFN